MSEVEYFLSAADLPLPTGVFFGDIVYEPGGTFGPRLQPTYQLLYLHSGWADVSVGRAQYRLGAGDMALLKPGPREFFRFAETTRTHHRWCHFAWSLPEKAAAVLDGLAFSAPLTQRAEHLTDLGLSLQHDPDVLGPSLGHLAAASFWEFVSAQVRRTPAGRATLPVALARVQTYIAQHYAEPLSLGDLAAVASLSPEHLTRLFRKHLRSSPVRELWRVRLEQGLLYLRHTGLTAEKIAYRCGFKTAAHFSRRVKAHCGLTPVQVRARHWRDGAPPAARTET